MIAPTALMTKDADKLTSDQKLLITIPDTIEELLKQPPDWWLNNVCKPYSQSLLFNLFHIWFLLSLALNPTSLVPDLELDV